MPGAVLSTTDTQAEHRLCSHRFLQFSGGQTYKRAVKIVREHKPREHN